MQDGFQCMACAFLLEDTGAQAGPVKATFGIKDVVAEVGHHRRQGWLTGLHDSARYAVGIGHENAQGDEFAFQCALARGDAASQSDDVVAHGPIM